MKSDRNVQAYEAVRQLLLDIKEDPNREGLKETPKRFVESLRERTSGYKEDPASYLKTFTEEDYDELVIVANIQVRSVCEHHLATMSGWCHVGYLPNGRIVGLSKFARVVEAFARRLTVQEKLTRQIATCINDALSPRAVGVIMQLRHDCMEARGVKTHGSITTTSCLLGGLREPAARSEFLTLIAQSRRDA